MGTNAHRYRERIADRGFNRHQAQAIDSLVEENLLRFDRSASSTLARAQVGATATGEPARSRSGECGPVPTLTRRLGWPRSIGPGTSCNESLAATVLTQPMEDHK